MRSFLLTALLGTFGFLSTAQTNLIINEISQGTNASKEFIELLVVGSRTCTDSTADLRNWIFDDHNGWYGGSGTGIAEGHYRFKDDPVWAAVPYGSIILIYNDADRNLKIPVGSDDPTDANNDYVYILPITHTLLEQNPNEPTSPSSFTYVYPASGYSNTVNWVSVGLANGGDAVITVNPANPATAHHSVVFGFTPAGGGQTPSVSKGAVGAGANLFLSNDQYNDAASWTIGTAGTADETPGEANSPLNEAWILAMRQQSNSFTITSTIDQPTCTTTTGNITITSPTGNGYEYTLNGGTPQTSPDFSGLTPGTYTIGVEDPSGCTATVSVTINNPPANPPTPVFTTVQPTCAVPGGEINITTPTGPDFTYSIDGTNFQSGTTFTNLTPGDYTLIVRNADGCTASATFTINNAPDAPDAPGVSSPVEYCLNQTATALTATGNNLLWYTAATGGTGSTTAPVPATTSVGSTSYFVSQTDNGCESSRAEIVVNVTDFTLPPITGNTIICLPGNITTTLSNTFAGGTWLSSNTSVATVNASGEVTGLSEGVTTISYSASNGACTDEVSVQIEVNNFDLELNGPFIPIAPNTQVTLTTSANTPYNVLSWQPAVLFADQTATSQVVTISESTEVVVTAENNQGCVDTARLSIAVMMPDEDIYIPSAFTPNNDGLNDVFRVYGNSVVQAEIWIFNQWGEMIFRSEGATAGWNGTHDGKLQPSGVYIYVAKVTLQSGEVLQRKGAINLIR